MNFLNTLERATKEGLLEWESGVPFLKANEKIKLIEDSQIVEEDQTTECYTAEFSGFKITTRVVPKQVNGSLQIGYAIEIKERTKKVVFTSNPNIIPGKKNLDVEATVIMLDEIIKSNLEVQLEKELQKLFC